MLMPMNSINIGSLISYSSGLLAYTMMLTVTFIARVLVILKKIWDARNV